LRASQRLINLDWLIRSPILEHWLHGWPIRKQLKTTNKSERSKNCHSASHVLSHSGYIAPARFVVFSIDLSEK